MRVSSSYIPLGVAALVFACLTHGQTPLRFDAASIHPNPTGKEGSVIDLGASGRLLVTNSTLKNLIRSAYGVQNDQIVGGPKWIDTDRYDIEAKTVGTITDRQEQPLMQDLLADRFKLKVHQEPRELTTYALLVAKNGPLFKKSTSNGSQIHNNRGPGRSQISVVKISIHQFASMLGKETGRIVADKTGLEGEYDFALTWDPEGTPDSTIPSLFAALQEQMGLRLESQKSIVPVLVVDSAEKASEN